MVGFILQSVVTLIGLTVRTAYLLGQLLGMAVIMLMRRLSSATTRRRRGATGSRPTAGRNYVPRPLSSHRLSRR